MFVKNHAESTGRLGASASALAAAKSNKLAVRLATDLPQAFRSTARRFLPQT
jgi:hypothetical protein